MQHLKHRIVTKASRSSHANARCAHAKSRESNTQPEEVVPQQERMRSESRWCSSLHSFRKFFVPRFDSDKQHRAHSARHLKRFWRAGHGEHDRNRYFFEKSFLLFSLCCRRVPDQRIFSWTRNVYRYVCRATERRLETDHVRSSGPSSDASVVRRQLWWKRRNL